MLAELEQLYGQEHGLCATVAGMVAFMRKNRNRDEDDDD